MPCSSRAPAVAGPTAATLSPARARASLPSPSSCSQKIGYRVLAGEDQPVVVGDDGDLARAAGPRSRRAICVAGISMTSAPRSRSFSLRRGACCVARVTTIRFPKSGRCSNQFSSSRRTTDQPITVITGAVDFLLFGFGREGLERRHDRALLGKRSPLDRGRRDVAGHSALDQRIGDRGESLHAHVQNDGAARLGEGRPVGLGARLWLDLRGRSQKSPMSPARGA